MHEIIAICCLGLIYQLMHVSICHKMTPIHRLKILLAILKMEMDNR